MTVNNKIAHPRYELREISTEKEVNNTRRVNYVEWGGGLSLNDYLAREEHLGNTKINSGTNLRTWGLYVQDSEGGEWERRSALETMLRPGAYKVKGQPIKVEDITTFSIGSVFTPEEHRGKGYAIQLFNQLTSTMDNWPCNKENGGKVFSFLWSDIGTYYNKWDYTLTEAFEYNIKVKKEGNVWPSEVEKISTSQLKAIADLNINQWLKKMDNDTEADGKTRVMIIPSVEVYEWSFARAEFLAPHFGAEKPEFFCAKHGDLSIVWTIHFVGKNINILRIITEDNCPSEIIKHKSFIKCINAVNSVAVQFNLNTITIWQQDLFPLESESFQKEAIKCLTSSGYTVDSGVRDGSLPNYRSVREPIEWVGEGKLTWM
ncbi:hypothetical protein NADFUDRAFT_68547 [Nadsonia fulvescens var. elongata DSM 6958]|uniref:LYC1 C-terminal domain-containing protein n=1 Tax=Nadsonia fulvescens var. elongata DSM 6958 TaxID=857566 RepID=A0A1E3PS73_9ASCO|nr:hypothetical protein NADFUDRAFT_68547 [Nadsonia fulvescens var. elongata DSM 6958]